MGANTIEERIRKNYNELTKSCQKVGEFLLKNMEEAAFFDISDFALEVGVSESTVIRFVRGIGYKGFPRMQEDLRTWLKERITPLGKMEKSVYKTPPDIYKDILENDIQNLNKLKKDFVYENFDEVVNTIIKSKHIYIIGYRTSFPIAYLLYMFLIEIIQNAEFLDFRGGEIYDRLIGLGRGDVLVAISFHRYSRVTSEIVKFAKSKRCKIIGITDSPLSPLGEIADIVLSVERSNPAFFNSYVACLSLINCILGGISLKKEKDAIHILKMGDQVLKQLKVHLR